MPWKLWYYSLLRLFVGLILTKTCKTQGTLCLANYGTTVYSGHAGVFVSTTRLMRERAYHPSVIRRFRGVGGYG